MKKILTVSDVCQTLRVSKPTARKMLKSGTLPGLQVGKSWRVSADVLENLVRGGGGSGGTSDGATRAA